jgi:hypothetical protein
MNFIATAINEFQNKQIYLGLTLKIMSKVKYEQIFEFLGHDFLYPGNSIFLSKTQNL